MVKGYTNLLITWTDCFTSIPVASEMLSTSKDKNVLRAFEKALITDVPPADSEQMQRQENQSILSDSVKAFLTKGIKDQYILICTPSSFLMC